MAETSDLGFDDPSFTEQEPQGNGAPGQGANGALDEDLFASGSPQVRRWLPCPSDQATSGSVGGDADAFVRVYICLWILCDDHWCPSPHSLHWHQLRAPVNPKGGAVGFVANVLVFGYEPECCKMTRQCFTFCGRQLAPFCCNLRQWSSVQWRHHHISDHWCS